jgi:hypothetical protein
MRTFGPQFLLVLLLSLLVAAAAITLACGSSPIKPNNCSTSPTGPNTTGALESVSLCPAVADAAQFPNGEVQFIASGVYNTAPLMVTPLQTTGWGACQAGAGTNDVVISSAGVAKCAAGASGTYSVYTSVPTNCEHVGPCGTGCMISGYAKLTCP